jgi:hypothetical protein
LIQDLANRTDAQILSQIFPDDCRHAPRSPQIVQPPVCHRALRKAFPQEPHLGFSQLWVAPSTSKTGTARGASLEFIIQFLSAPENCCWIHTRNERQEIRAAPTKSVCLIRRDPTTFLFVQTAEEHIQLMM